jgi:hypothetical protein
MRAEYCDGTVRLGWQPNDDVEVRKAKLLKHCIEAAAPALATRRYGDVAILYTHASIHTPLAFQRLDHERLVGGC